jgi:predicted transcriptional regulator
VASTSVHLPPDVVEGLDRLAAESGTSRNRLVVEACRRLIREEAGQWPEGFFSNEHLSATELRELEEAGAEMLEAIRRARRSRRKPPL